MTKRRRLRTTETPQATSTDAVIYARVSSKEQAEEGFSIPSQLKLLRGYADKHGLQVIREFVDVETAKMAGRTQFGKMLEYLERHPESRTILVEKTDRLTRNLRDCVALDDLDPRIHFVKEDCVYWSGAGANEKLLYGIKVLIAKQYIDNLSQETKKGQREKAEQGYYPSYAPYGYVNVVRDGRKVIEPDPERAPMIARIFEEYATGRHSLKDITQMAKEAGLVSRKAGKPVAKSIIHNIFRNPMYYGGFMYDGVQYEGKYEPLISEELWLRVQETLNGRGGSDRRKVKHDFAFSGLLTCGHCGCALVGEIQKGKYTYYHCTGYKGKCGEPYVREEVLEEQFWEFVRRVAVDKETLEWVGAAIREGHADEQRYHRESLERLQRRYGRLQDRLDVMYTEKLDGKIDEEFFDRMSVQWRSEQEEVLASIRRHQEADQSHMVEGARIFELAASAHELFAKQTPHEKRRLLDFLLSNCTWKHGQLSAEYRQPFDILAVAATEHRSRKAAGSLPDDLSEIWLLRQDLNLQPSG